LFKIVVFPAPKKPERTVTGIRFLFTFSRFDIFFGILHNNSSSEEIVFLSAGVYCRRRKSGSVVVQCSQQ
jgi:hypothetical protein